MRCVGGSYCHSLRRLKLLFPTMCHYPRERRNMREARMGAECGKAFSHWDNTSKGILSLTSSWTDQTLSFKRAILRFPDRFSNWFSIFVICERHLLILDSLGISSLKFLKNHNREERGRDLSTSAGTDSTEGPLYKILGETISPVRISQDTLSPHKLLLLKDPLHPPLIHRTHHRVTYSWHRQPRWQRVNHSI